MAFLEEEKIHSQETDETFCEMPLIPQAPADNFQGQVDEEQTEMKIEDNQNETGKRRYCSTGYTKHVTRRSNPRPGTTNIR